MKKLVSFLLIICLVLSLASCNRNDNVTNDKTIEPTQSAKVEPTPTVAPVTTAPEIKDDNLIPGGDFTKLDSMWGTYMESGGDGAMKGNSDGQLEVKVNKTGSVKHAMQVYCDGFELLQNAVYEFSFDIKSTINRTMDWRFQINGGDYHAYASGEGVKLTTEMQHLTYEFTMAEASDKTPRFCFNLGFYEEDGKLDPHTVYIDNVKLTLKDDSNAVSADAGSKEMAININQVGYLANDVKMAIFRDSTADTEFNVVKADSGEVVYTGQITGAKDSASADEKVAYGDFSKLKTPGTYKITAKNAGESGAFVIGDDVYSNLFNDTVKMLYLQRCGSKLGKEAGDFTHDACHTEKATIYGTNEKKDVSGGWHDAGDYGRYVVPGAKTVADLLLAYEEYGSLFGDASGIPESGNKVPDVLDEARYELEWMLKMQDGKSGGVYHKVTGYNFEGNTVMPQDVKDEQVIMPVSVCATGDFSAVMAMASRVYSKYDAAFAKKCLKASKLAMNYLDKNLQQEGYKNPSDVTTGEYGDTENKDEYLWALAELYKTTGDSSYQAKIATLDFTKLQDGLGWMGVNFYGYYAYLTSKNQDASISSKIKADFTTYIDEVKGNIDKDGYYSSIGEEYPWGSNMTVANNGMALLMANKVLKADSNNKVLAKEQLNYLLGANTTSYCFVTGYGTISPVSTHHRPSQALGKTMKGMLVGGPNSNLEDPYAKTVLAGLPAAKCYADNAQSYSCNEITIYWNSPLVFLLAGVQAK